MKPSEWIIQHLEKHKSYDLANAILAFLDQADDLVKAKPEPQQSSARS